MPPRGRSARRQCGIRSPASRATRQNVGLYCFVLFHRSLVFAAGFFASTTRTNNREQRFVIGTNGHFMLLEPSTLQFSYYNSGVRGRLRVCTDFPTAAVCPFVEEGSDMSADWRQWRTAMVKLKPGKTKVCFFNRVLNNRVCTITRLTAAFYCRSINSKLRDRFRRHSNTRQICAFAGALPSQIRGRSRRRLSFC